MRIEVIKVEVESKGKYSTLNVTYKGPDGKVESKKLVSFGPASDAFKVLKDASSDDVFEVKSEKIKNVKDDTEYWYWTEAVVIGKVDSVVAGSNKIGTTTPRSTYETPEERARKQVYIVRQSSITAALGLLTLQGAKDVDTDDVLAYARQFESYVFDTKVDKGFNLPDIEVR